MRASVLVVFAGMVCAAAPAFAGKGSNPQFPAPNPACFNENGDGSVTVAWTDVVSTVGKLAPTKYAIQIVVTEDTNLDDCGSVTSTSAYDFTAPTNPNSTFTTPAGLTDAFTCNVAVLVKALNPPGKSQNNPQALAGAGCGGGGSTGGT
jgi:hypothetical protein